MGVAGGWLDRILEALGIDRAALYLTNVVRCRPPENRTPLADEMQACVSRWLLPEMEAVRPELVFLFGSAPSRHFLRAPIRTTHGRLWSVEGLPPLFPLFHPMAVGYDVDGGSAGARALTRADVVAFSAFLAEVDGGRSSWRDLARPASDLSG